MEPQSVPVPPSLRHKNNHRKESKKPRGKRKCDCLPPLSIHRIYTFCFQILTRLFLFSRSTPPSPDLFSKEDRLNPFCSPPHCARCLFLNPGFLLRLISVWGTKRKENTPEEIKKVTMNVISCGKVVLFFWDQAGVLDSYQWYSNSAPLCEREATERRGGGE